MKKQFLAACLLGAITLPATAEGIYLFGDIGESKIEVSVEDYSTSKTDSALSIGAGYNFNDTLALEFAYRDLGSITNHDTDYSTYDYSDELSVTALQVSLVAKKPLNDAVDVYGRIGFGRLNSDYQYTAVDSYGADHYSYSQSKNKALFGIGASYAINQQLSFRAEYSRFSKWDGAILSTLTLGAKYNF